MSVPENVGSNDSTLKELRIGTKSSHEARGDHVGEFLCIDSTKLAKLGKAIGDNTHVETVFYFGGDRCKGVAD